MDVLRLYLILSQLWQYLDSENLPPRTSPRQPKKKSLNEKNVLFLKSPEGQFQPATPAPRTSPFCLFPSFLLLSFSFSFIRGIFLILLVFYMYIFELLYHYKR